MLNILTRCSSNSQKRCLRVTRLLCRRGASCAALSDGTYYYYYLLLQQQVASPTGSAYVRHSASSGRSTLGRQHAPVRGAAHHQLGRGRGRAAAEQQAGSERAMHSACVVLAATARPYYVVGSTSTVL